MATMTIHKQTMTTEKQTMKMRIQKQIRMTYLRKRLHKEGIRFNSYIKEKTGTNNKSMGPAKGIKITSNWHLFNSSPLQINQARAHLSLEIRKYAHAEFLLTVDAVTWSSQGSRLLKRKKRKSARKDTSSRR